MKNTILFTTIACTVLLSCRTEEGCKIGENYVKDENYHLVLSAKPEKLAGNGTWYYLTKGKDISTSKDTVLHLENIRWYEKFYYRWDKGDTLIKVKGSLITEIHKKDTVYYMEWDCDDPKINGISTRLSKPPKRHNN